MAVRSLKKIPIHVWIPPVYDALYKIEVIRGNGSVDDITDLILNGDFADAVTSNIGNFTFNLDNSSEDWTNVWTGGERINIYMDYAVDATTLRFSGFIEKVSYPYHQVKISGRSLAVKLLDITVTKAFSGIETSIILQDLISSYLSDFTFSNVNASTIGLTVNWYQKPLFDAIRELCEASGFDFYIDSSSDCHYFESGSVNNSTEIVVHDSNLLDISDFAYDLSSIKNRIIVYGADIGNLPLIWTSDDNTSQTNYGVKELIITDQNITTMQQAKDRADYELARLKDPPLVGDITSKGLATLQPGEKIRISAPDSNLQPNYYKIISYKHEFGNFHQTILTIEKETKKISKLFRDRIDAEQSLSNQPNPNEMRYTYNIIFDVTSGVHSNTVIQNNVLQTNGSSSGTWISNVKSLTSNATSGELRVTGDQLSGTLYYFSVDNGINWTLISPNTATNFTPPGLNLKLKINLNSATTQISSLVLLFK